MHATCQIVYNKGFLIKAAINIYAIYFQVAQSHKVVALPTFQHLLLLLIPRSVAPTKQKGLCAFNFKK